MKLTRHRSLVMAVSFMVLNVIVMGGVLPSSAADIPRMKQGELKKLIESNDPNTLVVDTQPKEVYDSGHIKGAVSFPWDENLKSTGSLPRNKTLILYCDCANEEDSTDVGEQLIKKFEYTNIKILEGGWSKWLEAGYPVDKK
jgi:rhodanese-related sulfurtransferase